MLPFPHKNAIGLTPPDEEAVHVMFEAVGAPTHVAVNAEAAPAKTSDSMNATLAADAMKLFLKIMMMSIYS